MTAREDSGGAMYSVLIGRVSTVDSARIFETLEALTHQTGDHQFEVIVADRRQDDITQKIGERYPQVRLLRAPARTSLPELRAWAREQARGEFIVVTEDHCVPASDWLVRIAEAFRSAPPGTLAVGGCIENGVGETWFDWATFLCEYGYFLPPIPEGVTTMLPGMNIAYRRAALGQVNPAWLREGFWETTVHPRLNASGAGFFASNAIRLTHKKKFSLGLFLAQRFLYSRYYAGHRAAGKHLGWKILMCLGTVLLPPLILYRIYCRVWPKRRWRAELLGATPYLLLFLLAWAAGETVGYAAGPGAALAALE
jgi:glycosyltransferase involved in cell wall biosynthesis